MLRQRRLIPPARDHHPHRPPAPGPHQERQEIQRLAIRPVHILHDQPHPRPGPRGHHGQQLRHPGEQPLPAPLPVPAARGRPAARVHLRQQPRHFFPHVPGGGIQRRRQQPAALQPGPAHRARPQPGTAAACPPAAGTPPAPPPSPPRRPGPSPRSRTGSCPPPHPPPPAPAAHRRPAPPAAGTIHPHGQQNAPGVPCSQPTSPHPPGQALPVESCGGPGRGVRPVTGPTSFYPWCADPAIIPVIAGGGRRDRASAGCGWPRIRTCGRSGRLTVPRRYRWGAARPRRSGRAGPPGSGRTPCRPGRGRRTEPTIRDRPAGR